MPDRVRTLFLATTLGLALALGAGCSPKGGAAAHIAPAALQQELAAGSAPLVIDVRSAEEYASGHIPGAINIPFDQVAGRIHSLQTPRGVALYCQKGPRAERGEQSLREAGYTDVTLIEGGFSAWQAAGLPVEQ